MTVAQALTMFMAYAAPSLLILAGLMVRFRL